MSKHKPPMGHGEMYVSTGETRTMPSGGSVIITAKNKKPPGHEETTLVSLQAELVVFNQRLTRLEKDLTEKVATSGTCSTVAVILAVAATLCCTATTVYLAMEAWS